MYIEAKYCSKELMEMLEEKEYRVHSCFEHGCNIAVDEYLSFVGNKEFSLLPYGIVINSGDYMKIKRSLEKGDTTLRWDNDSKSFYNANIELLCKGAISYTSACSGAKMDIEQSLMMLLSATQKSWMTGFGKEISELCSDDNKEVETLMLSAQSELSEEMKILNEFVGFGQGLTPSGDDLLLGILFVDCMIPFVSREWKEELKKLYNGGYTTDISVHYYRSAYNKLFSSDLLSLRQGLLEGNRELVVKSINAILKIGHTSGKDLIAGILIAMKYLKNIKREMRGKSNEF